MHIRICFCILVCAFLANGSGLAQGKPSIQFDSLVRDAGTVPQGDVVKQVFAFINKGSGNLEILNVEHS